MKAKALIHALERALETKSQKELAKALGVSQQMLINWRNQNKNLQPHQVANALAKAKKQAVNTSYLHMIKPIVEFYPIEKIKSRHGAKYEFFPTKKGALKQKQKLREILCESFGIYLFYDSRGRALYAGQAKRTSLWSEMHNAFNRDRGEVQAVNLVRHTLKKAQEFSPAHEFNRQPKPVHLELQQLAFYFSAYKVDEGMIDDLEALLVRGFANDLLNVKMERFAHAKQK